MRFIVFLTAIFLTAARVAGAASDPAVQISGTILSAGAKSLVIATPSGQKAALITSRTKLFGVDRSSLDKITQDSFIGTTVAPQPDGTYTSTEVHIFEPALRGTGEGFTKMNDSGHHMMANSTVRTVAQPHMMANSTVRTVGSSASGKTITMTFPSGTKTIRIPSTVPVMYIERANSSMLKQGAHVQVIGDMHSGLLRARYVIVGEHGLVPPN